MGVAISVSKLHAPTLSQRRRNLADPKYSLRSCRCLISTGRPLFFSAHHPPQNCGWRKNSRGCLSSAKECLLLRTNTASRVSAPLTRVVEKISLSRNQTPSVRIWRTRGTSNPPTYEPRVTRTTLTLHARLRGNQPVQVLHPSRNDPQITDSLADSGTGLLVHKKMTSRHLYSCFDTLGKGHFQSADELCDNGVWVGYLAEESYVSLPLIRRRFRYDVHGPSMCLPFCRM